MLKDNVLVKKINGIETAGSLNILFSDKTGTITKGQLEVVEFLDSKRNSYKNYNEIPDGLKTLLKNSIVENTTAIANVQNNKVNIIGGNSTERALFGFLEYDIEHDKEVEISQQIPFNSINKYSATTIRMTSQPEGEGYITLIKGAPEKIINKCTHYFNNMGRKYKFGEAPELEVEIANRAKKSMRMLALAISNKPIENNNIELQDLTLVGVVAIRDEVRPEAITAIKEVQNAGIQVVMITGDIKDTAMAIAKDSGIITSENDIVLTSRELQDMSDDNVKEILPRLKVVARALPSDKSRLVKVAQEMNLVAGMSGDGRHICPAL